MSVFTRALLPLFTLAAAASPAVAQQRIAIEVPADRPFVHRHTGIALPTSIRGLPRLRVEDMATPQLDVMVNYESSDVTQAVTVYLYHSADGGVPVWFDRATWAVESRPLYGTPKRRDTAPAFVPPGRTNASGMLAVYDTSGQYRSTAVALMPMGLWLVKIRYSSTTLDGAALEAGLREAIAAITWPADLPAAPVAEPVMPCDAPLTFRKPARIVRSSSENSLGNVLVDSVLASAAAAKRDAAPRDVRWCRDPAQPPVGAVFRADQSTSAYLIALSDAGRGVSVAPQIDFKTGKDSRWGVRLAIPGNALIYPSFDRLPDPAAALAIVQGQPVAQTSTLASDKAIRLQVPPR